MNKRKKLLASGIVKDIWFVNQAEYEIYIYDMEQRGTTFQVAETYQKEDGSFLARIVVEYGGTNMIWLFN